MERASKLIRGLRVPGQSISSEQIACAAWAQTVGKKIAAHTRATRMVRNHLIVEVEDRVWQKQLMTLSPQILAALERSVGRGVVDDLEFRVTPRRMEPQRAAAAVPALIADEAEGIADPVLRSIYKTSRKRSLA